MLRLLDTYAGNHKKQTPLHVSLITSTARPHFKNHKFLYTDKRFHTGFFQGWSSS